MPQLSTFEVERATEKLKNLGIDKIPAELIKARGITFHSRIRKPINSVWNKKELLEEWKDSVILSSYKKGDKNRL